jgi:hypothetical protein
LNKGPLSFRIASAMMSCEYQYISRKKTPSKVLSHTDTALADTFVGTSRVVDLGLGRTRGAFPPTARRFSMLATSLSLIAIVPSESLIVDASNQVV